MHSKCSTAFEGHHWSFCRHCQFDFCCNSHVDLTHSWQIPPLVCAASPCMLHHGPVTIMTEKHTESQGAGEQDRAASSGSRSRVIPQQEEERAVPRRYGHLPDRWAWWQEGRNNLQFHRLIRSVNVPCRPRASHKHNSPVQARRACFLKVGLQELAKMCMFTHTCDGRHTWKKKNSFLHLHTLMTHRATNKKRVLDSSPGRLSGLCDFASW